MRTLAISLALLATLGCTSSYTSTPEPLGTPCDTDVDCGGGVCVAEGADRLCTRECTDLADDCPEGWTCGAGDATRPALCRCAALTVERCNERDDDCDGRVDEGLDCEPTEPPPPGECGDTLDCFAVRPEPVRELDLLFVIDDSGSMAQEQNALSRELPRLFASLAASDVVRSFHVGVVRTDMGTGGYVVPTCTGRFGGDGILITRGNVARPGCAESYPSFFEFDRSDDPTAFGNELRCVVGMGTAGCGFEQQLEATLKALTPSTSPIRFDGRSVGHADGRNAGFLRPESVLAVVMLSDEEDCSAADPAIYDPASTTYGGDLNLRCWTYGDPANGVVHPVERFVEGLLATRPDPSRLVMSAIVGIPPETAPLPGSRPDFEGILRHPDMVEMVDPATPSRLRPSCDRTDEAGERAIAFPPRRIVRTLEGLANGGASTTVTSICDDQIEGAVERTLAAIADAANACFARRLPGEGDAVACRLVETLPPGRACEELPGRRRRTTTRDASGQRVEVCEVTQLPTFSAGEGWVYSEIDPECPDGEPNRVRWTTPPPLGSSARLECDR